MWLYYNGCSRMLLPHMELISDKTNRPIRFRNDSTDTTVECGYDSQGRRLLQKSNGRGNGNASSSLHLSRIFANCLRGLHAFRSSGALARYLGSVASDGDASARDSKRRHVVHLRLAIGGGFGIGVGIVAIGVIPIIDSIPTLEAQVEEDSA